MPGTRVVCVSEGERAWNHTALVLQIRIINCTNYTLQKSAYSSLILTWLCVSMLLLQQKYSPTTSGLWNLSACGVVISVFPFCLVWVRWSCRPSFLIGNKAEDLSWIVPVSYGNHCNAFVNTIKGTNCPICSNLYFFIWSPASTAACVPSGVLVSHIFPTFPCSVANQMRPQKIQNSFSDTWDTLLMQTVPFKGIVRGLFGAVALVFLPCLLHCSSYLIVLSSHQAISAAMKLGRVVPVFFWLKGNPATPIFPEGPLSGS